MANKKAPDKSDAFLVELVEKNLHPIMEELVRWQSIIGEHYLSYKLEEQRKKLGYNS